MSLTLLVLNFPVLGHSQSLLEVLDWEHISFSLNFSVYYVRLLNPDEVASFAAGFLLSPFSGYIITVDNSMVITTAVV